MFLFANAFYLAWSDTKARYKKSILGPLWLTLGNIVGVLGLSLVWGNLLNENMQKFVPSLTIGLIVWQLISCSIADSPTTFVRHASMVKNIVVPAWFFAARGISRQIINFFHNIVIVVFVIFYFNMESQSYIILSLFGCVLVMANLFWMTFLIGLLGARFRDIEYLINSFLPLLFFISPVIFRPDRLPISMSVIWMNPLSYFIEIIRAPLLGTIPSLSTYIIVIGMLLFGSLASFVANKWKGQELAFWI